MGWFEELWERSKSGISGLLDFGWGAYQDQMNRGMAEHQFRQLMDFNRYKYNKDSAFSREQWDMQNVIDSRNFKYNTAMNRWQMDFAKRQYKQGIQDRVKDAKAAGINPLVAMGQSAYTPGPSMISGQMPRAPMPSGSSGSPTNYHMRGQGLVETLYSNKMRSLQIGLAQEELTQSKIRTEQMLNPPKTATVPDTVVSQEQGTTHGVHGNWIIVEREGNRFSLENKERKEPEEALLSWMQTEGKKLTMGTRGVYYNIFTKRQQARLNNYIWRRRKVLDSIRPLPAGKMYKWDLSESCFIVGNNDGKMFAQEPLRFTPKKKVYMNEFMTGNPPKKSKWDKVPYHKIPKRR